jgi:hypothetical protein
VTLERKGKVLCRRQTYFNIGVASARAIYIYIYIYISYIEWLLLVRISFLCFFVLPQIHSPVFFLLHSNAYVIKSSYCVTPRSLTASYPCSRGTCYLHLQGSLFRPAIGGSKFLQNVCNELPLYAGSYTQKTTIPIVSAMRTCNDKKRLA